MVVRKMMYYFLPPPHPPLSAAYLLEKKTGLVFPHHITPSSVRSTPFNTASVPSPTILGIFLFSFSRYLYVHITHVAQCCSSIQPSKLSLSILIYINASVCACVQQERLEWNGINPEGSPLLLLYLNVGIKMKFR